MNKCDVEDVVNSPSPYKVGGIETIDFIEAKQLGYITWATSLNTFLARDIKAIRSKI